MNAMSCPQPTHRPIHAELLIVVAEGIQRQAEKQMRPVPNNGEALGEAGLLIEAYRNEIQTWRDVP